MSYWVPDGHTAGRRGNCKRGRGESERAPVAWEIDMERGEGDKRGREDREGREREEGERAPVVWEIERGERGEGDRRGREPQWFGR